MKVLSNRLKSLFYKIKSGNSFNDVTASKSKAGGLPGPGRFVEPLAARFTGEVCNKCENVTSLQETYLKGRLGKQQLALLNFHLRECAACSKKRAAVEELLSILFYTLQPVAPDPRVRASLLDSVKSKGE